MSAATGVAPTEGKGKMTRIPVYRTAKCKRCNSETVTWHQSAKTGKWYLAETFVRGGQLESDHRDFHSLYCGKPKKHAAVQNEIDSDEKAKDEQYEKLTTVNEKRIEEENTQRLLGWIAMSDADRTKRLRQITNRLDWYEKNPPSMDFIVEYGQAMAEIRELKQERDFLTAMPKKGA
jgi:hypothetical protein